MNCSNSFCHSRNFLGTATILKPVFCDYCKDRQYCDKSCKLQDWNQGHDKVCYNTYLEKLASIERRCPFLNDGVVLSYEQSMSTKQASSLLSEYEPVVNPGGMPVTLGKGSYGEVILMRHKSTKKEIAMKIIEKKCIGNAIMLQTLKREIDIHQKLIHKNVIRLIASVDEPKYIYILMEYASKGSLFQLIRHNKKLTEKQAFYFFTEACSAINFLHKHNLMHRDIKPENLLINETGELKLCDFGCCVQYSDIPRKTFCGTIEYMAPEIVQRKEYSVKADVWSLGILLYEMLHGYAPFQGRRDHETMAKILERKIVFGTNIPQDAKEIIELMLNEEANERPNIVELFVMPWIKRMQKEFDIKDRVPTKSTIAKDKKATPEKGTISGQASPKHDLAGKTSPIQPLGDAHGAPTETADSSKANPAIGRAPSPLSKVPRPLITPGQGPTPNNMTPTPEGPPIPPQPLASSQIYPMILQPPLPQPSLPITTTNNSLVSKSIATNSISSASVLDRFAYHDSSSNRNGEPEFSIATIKDEGEERKCKETPIVGPSIWEKVDQAATEPSSEKDSEEADLNNVSFNSDDYRYLRDDLNLCGAYYVNLFDINATQDEKNQHLESMKGHLTKLKIMGEKELDKLEKRETIRGKKNAESEEKKFGRSSHEDHEEERKEVEERKVDKETRKLNEYKKKKRNEMLMELDNEMKTREFQRGIDHILKLLASMNYNPQIGRPRASYVEALESMSRDSKPRMSYPGPRNSKEAVEENPEFATAFGEQPEQKKKSFWGKFFSLK